MNPHLKLRKNDPIVNEQAKKIIAWMIKAKLSTRNLNLEFFEKEALEEAGIVGIRFITISTMTALDYGWLKYSLLVEGGDFPTHGKRLNGILKSRSNTHNWDRSIHINCPSAAKRQKFFVIEADLLNYSKNFIVVNQRNKIVPSMYAAMQSHGWNENSPEALALVRKYIPLDYDRG